MPTKWRSGNKDVGRDKTRPLFVYEENKIWQRWFLFHIFSLYFLRFSGSFGKLNESIRLNVPVFRFIKAKANNIEHVLLPDHCSSDYSFTVFTPEPKFACLNRTFAVCGISRISCQKQFLFFQWLHLFIKETVTFGRVKINCVKLWVSIFLLPSWTRSMLFTCSEFLERATWHWASSSLSTVYRVQIFAQLTCLK